MRWCGGDQGIRQQECMKIANRHFLPGTMLIPLSDSVDFGTGVLRNFTKVQILHPVAGALALIALIWGLVRHLSYRLIHPTY